MKKRFLLLYFAAFLITGVVTFIQSKPAARYIRTSRASGHSSDEIILIPHPSTTAEKIVNGAKQEVINEVRYDAAYMSIPYPNGDVPRTQGACTDVVVRALRNAGYDLQKLVHKDMSRNFSLYPKKWGLSRPDSNIDHRRVPNLMVFFNRFGKTLTTRTATRDANQWKPGDIVCWDLNGNGMTHIGVISNEKNGDGLPLVIHNIGSSASQEDCLESWRIIGHYRYPKTEHF